MDRVGSVQVATSQMTDRRQTGGSCHLMWSCEGEILQLYSYRQVLGDVKIFPQGSSGGAGPLTVNLGPPIISETTGARKLKLKTQLDVVKYSLRVQNFFR